MQGNPIEHGLWHWDSVRYPPAEHADQRPLKLNVHQPCKVGKDHLGSQEYSGAFYRYLDPVFQAAADKERLRPPWWHFAYIVDRLKADGAIAQNQLAALLAIRCADWTWDRALVFFRCTKEQLGRLERRIRRQYLPRIVA